MIQILSHIINLLALIVFAIIACYYASKAGRLGSRNSLLKTYNNFLNDERAMLRRSLIKEREDNKILTARIEDRDKTIKRDEERMLDMAHELGEYCVKLARLERERSKDGKFTSKAK